MDRNEIRYRITSTLLQAGDPLSLAELVDGCGIAEGDLLPVLKELVAQGSVVEGELVPDKPAPQYCWSTRWQRRAQRRSVSAVQELRAAVSALDKVPGFELDVESKPARAFYDYVINEYRPPADKRFLVFLQCSVRRPFSTSPSHASMRKAIRTATGYDPRKDFESCPVHVVVLASKIGPVPYDLEDVYPANVRGGGVKHFDRKIYVRVKPVLAERMAQYLITHGDNYEHIATFTEGRYAEVMQEARDIIVERCAGDVDFPILPQLSGPRIVRAGKSRPRQYWARYWIQLYLEIVSWLDPEQRAQAETRLKKLQVDYSGSSARKGRTREKTDT
jgi:hypothetical protein